MKLKIVYVPTGILEEISAESENGARKGEERCGKLLGYVYDEAIVVAHATFRGMYSATKCVPDIDEAAEILRSRVALGERIELVGDWHSHWFEDYPRPSRADIASVKSMLRAYEEYRDRYVILLVAKRGIAAYSYSIGDDQLYQLALAPISRAAMFEPEDVLVGSRHSSFWRLLDKTVAIVGLGSGGSTISLMLAEAGVGKFKLVDHEVLAPANVTRHIAGLSGVGEYKVDVIADVIRDHNPYSKIEKFRVKVDEESSEDLARIAEDADIILAMTDSHSSNVVVNDIAVSLGKPLVSAFVGPGAEYANVILVPGDRSRGCYRCVLSYMGIKTSVMEPPPKVKAMYGQPATGALHVDMLPAVFLAVRTILQVLEGEDPGFSLVYIDNKKLARGGEKLLSFVKVPRKENCPACTA